MLTHLSVVPSVDASWGQLLVDWDTWLYAITGRLRSLTVFPFPSCPCLCLPGLAPTPSIRVLSSPELSLAFQRRVCHPPTHPLRRASWCASVHSKSTRPSTPTPFEWSSRTGTQGEFTIGGTARRRASGQAGEWHHCTAAAAGEQQRLAASRTAHQTMAARQARGNDDNDNNNDILAQQRQDNDGLFALSPTATPPHVDGIDVPGCLSTATTSDSTHSDLACTRPHKRVRLSDSDSATDTAGEWPFALRRGRYRVLSLLILCSRPTYTQPVPPPPLPLLALVSSPQAPSHGVTTVGSRVCIILILT